MRAHPGTPRSSVRARRLVPLAAAVAAAIASARGAPQEAAAVPAEEHRHDVETAEWGPGFLEREFLTGAWWGARSDLADRGIAVEALLTSDYSDVLSGGRRPHATAFRYLFDLIVTVDSRAVGFEGGTFQVDAQRQRGENGSSDVGDAQGYSNIDADGRSQIAKLWWEQRWIGDDLRTRAGKIDANALFAWTEHGARFLNSSMGYSPTILGFPTYPDPAFGLTLHGRPAAALEVGLGVFDGALQEGVPTGSHGASTLFGEPSDLFLIAEIDASWGAEGRAGLGGWWHTGTFARFDGGQESGTGGLYFVLDQILWSAPAPRTGGVGLFAQLGLSDEDVAPIAEHQGAGAVWTGAFGREHDALGLGFTRAGFSSLPGAGFDAEAELAVELFYSWHPSPWLSLKPDLQYIHDPGGDGALDPAWVLTLRTSVSF